MFTRIVECHVKTNNRDELTTKIRTDVLPILQKQPGFVELIGLTHETNPERVVSISMWKSREDADRYHKENFKRITEMLKPLLTSDPIVDTYTVNTSTTHKIASGRAA